MEEQTVMLATKLLNIFNQIVDKATGPEALMLMKNYMMYIMVSHLFYVLLPVIGVIVSVYAGTCAYRAIKRWNKTRDRGDDDTAFVGTILSIITGLPSVPVMFLLAPKWIMIVYDPRLYFVFKAIDGVIK